ncbi:hypothetical protein OK015_19775 [Mycobacterium sp. Aquia_216]|uniref:hypothetical protein n=1 Tax=Mycobacterium sp. Aquia_216 TaxID=2991729 RepID=UPI00227BDB40|nr:hypothetical protein [Mycobacterium sp. Aquia_216]WAJ43436.1 hypothetical protein OK015_19775 [Mycobacterium sp. Aquia_216]
MVELIIVEANMVRLDDVRRALISTLQKAGSVAEERLWLQRPDRTNPPNSFDMGLEMVMRSLREDVKAREYSGESRSGRTRKPAK